MSSHFRQRCESAMTHPVTVAALVVLPVNDWLLKTLWSNPWTTGKLSDLAWVVFASPMLAFGLSFVVRGSVVAQRTAIVVAYIGLPMLYAAFNTFESVHYWILRGLAVVGGGGTGSPLDPSDSLVIPFGLGIAFWVWRRRLADPRSLRTRLGFMTAAIAALATVATTPFELDVGITRVGILADGSAVVAETSGERSVQYKSEDGGFSWTEIPLGQNLEVEWGDRNVESPHGMYRLHGTDIYRVTQSDTQLVHSMPNLSEEPNRWVQEQATEHLDRRILATGSHSITYDDTSGNVIVALGILGVVVGSPDGNWNGIAVGPYLPVDFSFLGKFRRLVTDHWISILAVSLAFVGGALIISECRREDIEMAVFPIIVVTVIFVMAMTGEGYGFLAFLALSVPSLGLLCAAILTARQGMARKVSSLVLTYYTALLPFLAFRVYGDNDAFTGEGLLETPMVLGTLLAIGLAGSTIALFWPRRYPLVSTITPLVCNIVIVLSMLSVWLIGTLTLAVAAYTTMGILSVLMLILQGLLRRVHRPSTQR